MVSPKPKVNSSNAFLKSNLLMDIPQQRGVFHPNSISDLKKIIDFARAHQAIIRPLGSQHSSPSAFMQENSVIYIVLDGELRKIQEIDSSEEMATVKVGAGCYLGVNPQDKTSTLANSFNFQIDQLGYALPTLGGISHQTIAGFLQTSSSGGSVKHGISDVIESIELINGRGELCQFHRGEDNFNAAMVAMGLFGIITSVTFKLPKKYLVEGFEENKEQANSFLAKDQHGRYTALYQALFEDHEYAHINWLPQKYINRTMQWTAKAVPADLPLKPYYHPLKSSFISVMASVVLSTTNILDVLGSQNVILQKLKSFLIKPFANLNETKRFRDNWYQALPIDDQADVNGLINTIFSEIWFPKHKIDEVMMELEKLLVEDPKASNNFIIEFYGAKKSPYWLSPSYQEDAFRVDLYWWKYNFGQANVYFTKFWNRLLSIPGARLHWGKTLPDIGQTCGEIIFNHEFLQKAYPKFNEWLMLREKMDPNQLFLSDYWRALFNIPMKLQQEIALTQTPMSAKAMALFSSHVKKATLDDKEVETHLNTSSDLPGNRP